jgi:hypothetical protein
MQFGYNNCLVLYRICFSSWYVAPQLFAAVHALLLTLLLLLLLLLPLPLLLATFSGTSPC